MACSDLVDDNAAFCHRCGSRVTADLTATPSPPASAVPPAAGHPPAPGYPAAPGYPPAAAGYPPVAAHPPAAPGYPAGPAYPAAPGYPPAAPMYAAVPAYGVPVYAHPVMEPPKSKAAAALLCFFLGGLGIHRFYTGQIGPALGLLLTTLLLGWTGVWLIVTFIWVTVDFILILSGGVKDKYGRPLV